MPHTTSYPVTRYTLAYLIRGDGYISLGLKAKGIGQGCWHGFGGKFQDDESSEQCLVREIFEELNIKATKFAKKGVLKSEDAESKYHGLVDIYIITEYTGEIKVSDEFSDFQWFQQDKLPTNEMMEDERIWLPKILASDDKSVIVKTHNHRVEIVSI